MYEPYMSYEYKVVELLFETRELASDRLDELETILTENRILRVSELYNLLEMSSTSLDDIHVWRDLTDAKIKPRGRYYVLFLPKPILLD